jgi:hypothetical protein
MRPSATNEHGDNAQLPLINRISIQTSVLEYYHMVQSSFPFITVLFTTVTVFAIYIWVADSVTFFTVCTHVVASRLSFFYRL